MLEDCLYESDLYLSEGRTIGSYQPQEYHVNTDDSYKDKGVKVARGANSVGTVFTSHTDSRLSRVLELNDTPDGNVQVLTTDLCKCYT